MNSSRIYIAPSLLVEGELGAFAKRNFLRGEYIGQMNGFEIPKEYLHLYDSHYILWLNDDHDDIPIFVTDDVKYINHSMEPNCVVEGVAVYASMDIAQDQELSFHYGDAFQAQLDEQIQ